MSLLIFILIFLLIALTAFFNGAETALTSANRCWIREQAENKAAGAGHALHFVKNTERFLGTVLIGQNLAAISLATLGRVAIGVAITHTAVMQRVIPAVGGTEAGWSAWITSLILTPVVLLLGEILPKAIGRAAANRVSLAVAPPMRCIERLLSPLVSVFTAISRFISKDAQESKDNQTVTRDDLKELAALAAEQGLVGEDAGEMLQSVLELDRRPVVTAMVPLIEISSLPDNATVNDLKLLTAKSGFTYIPVYHQRVDRIFGVVSLKEIILDCERKHIAVDDCLGQPLTPFIRKELLFVPETQCVTPLLDELRRKPIPLAVVVDEFGGITGLVTIEDLVELIVGNLHDERDEEHSKIQRLSSDAFICSGRMDLSLLEEYLGQDLPNAGFSTAAGLVLKLAGRIPEPGEQFHFRQMSVTVLETENHRITRLKFQSSPVKN